VIGICTVGLKKVAKNAYVLPTSQNIIPPNAESTLDCEGRKDHKDDDHDNDDDDDDNNNDKSVDYTGKYFTLIPGFCNK
jgi:hypothetical protein